MTTENQTNKEYEQLLQEEPYYTQIPQEYYQKDITSMDYVKKTLHTTQITPTNLLQACSLRPEIFSQWMLGITLRPYQTYAIHQMHNNTHTAMCWSRRTGKTTITKLYVLWTAIFNKLPGQLTGTTWNIILQDQEIANTLYIEPLHEMMERGNKIIQKNFQNTLGDTWLTNHLVTRRDKYGKVKSNQITLKTQTGICRINTMPPTNKAIGREGNIIGDEVSKWKHNPKCTDEYKFYDQLVAITKDQPNYKTIFLTTPEGPTDLFATRIFDPQNTNPQNPYKKIWYPHQVRNEPNWKKQILQTKNEAKRNGTIPLYQQEYEAKFTTISEPYIPYHLIKQNTTQQLTLQTHEHNTPCSLGIDWGGNQKSETALTITKWNTQPTTQRTIIYLKTFEINQDLTELEPELQKIKNNYNIKWVIIDNKGGRWMIPKLQKLYGPTRVHEFNFTTEKTTGYEKLRNALTHKTITLPNHTKLLNQLSQLNHKLKPTHTNQKDDLADSTMLSIQPLYPDQTKTFTIHQY